MSCVFKTDKVRIFGVPVEICTVVTAPYGDASISFSLLLPDNEKVSLHFKGERSVVDLGEHAKPLGLSRLTAEDESILISSAQHNLDLEGECANVYKTIKKISELFAIEPDGVPF